MVYAYFLDKLLACFQFFDYIETSWERFKFLWGFKFLKSKDFNFLVRQENARRKWYQGVIHNCDDFNFDEILWGIKYAFILYLQ